MKKIETIAEFNEIFRANLSKKGFSNLEGLLFDAEGLIRQGTLFYEPVDGGVFFFQDEGAYFQTYYALKGDVTSAICPRREKPCILDFIFKPGKEGAFPALLEEGGWRPYMKRRSATMDVGEAARAGVLALEEDAEKITELQWNHIDPYTGHCLPVDEMAEEIKNERVFASYDGARLRGYLRYSSRSRHLILENIVVSPGARGEGVGRELVEMLMAVAKEKGFSAIRLWVREDNEAAIRLYGGFPFRFGDYECVNYILEEMR